MGRHIFAMMIGRLVVLAAALSALAYAAPTLNPDAVVPEEMVQTRTQVASSVALLKKQFSELEVQLKSGANVTPAVSKTLDKMIDMVNDDIEPAIKEAHSADQDELDSKMGIIVDFNDDNYAKREILYNEFASINDDIDMHNTAAQKWDNAASAYSASVDLYEKTVKEKTDTCCDKQQAAVGAIEYTPAYASCDYTSADAHKCTDVATGNVATAVNADFSHGLKRYRDLVHGCKTKTSEVASTGADMNSKDKHCDDSQADCIARQGAIADKKSQFESDWKTTTTDYAAGIAEREKTFNDAATRVHKDESDRHNEWGSTQEIKCLLRAYQAGGTFDEAQMNICKDGITTADLVIHYAPVPAQVQWPLDDYDDMTDTSPYADTCQRVEAADEAADTRCNIKATPADSTCDKSSADDGPAWNLSAAGASFVQ